MKALWTDGSAEPNPGPGGWAVIEVANGEGRPVALGCDAKTTNIRMEGAALIAAMKYAGGEKCEIYTDSEFWVKVLTQWAEGWKASGWRKRGGPIKNLEMVQKMYKLYCNNPVKLRWVRGHVGIRFNEMADEWASRARLGEKI